MIRRPPISTLFPYTTLVRSEKLLAEEGVRTLGWREVPVDDSVCGAQALRSLPKIEQIFVARQDGDTDAEFNRRLYMARRRAELEIEDKDPVFYVASLSCTTLSFKAMVMPAFLTRFYTDLASPDLEAAICVFHQRFSTNTWPQWKLAQPFRYLAHNGEINTIQGNRNWANARAYKFQSDLIPDMSLACERLAKPISLSQCMKSVRCWSSTFSGWISSCCKLKKRLSLAMSLT